MPLRALTGEQSSVSAFWASGVWSTFSYLGLWDESLRTFPLGKVCAIPFHSGGYLISCDQRPGSISSCTADSGSCKDQVV